MTKEEIKTIIRTVDGMNEKLDLHSGKLNELPKLADGRISDEYRATEFYKYHKQEYDKQFSALRKFNSSLSNKQKREISKYRREMKLMAK